MNNEKITFLWLEKNSYPKLTANMINKRENILDICIKNWKQQEDKIETRCIKLLL